MTVTMKNRHRLKKKEIRNILNELKTNFSSKFFNINSSVEIGYLDQFKVILVDEDIDFMVIEENVVFTLHGIYKYNPKERFVVVDIGAVVFVSKGADVMAPGIIDADTKIQINDYIWICDEKHHKPLAIGMALMTGEEMKRKNVGKAIKNIHFVGDRLWNLTN